MDCTTIVTIRIIYTTFVNMSQYLAIKTADQWFKAFLIFEKSHKYLSHIFFVKQLVSKILTAGYRYNRKRTVVRGRVESFYV